MQNGLQLSERFFKGSQSISGCAATDAKLNNNDNDDNNNNNNNNNNKRPRTRNTENVAYENHSDLCSCRCAWYSKEGDGRKHRESSKESYCDRDSKDLHESSGR